MPGTLMGLPVLNRRKAGTTSSHHGLYAQGLTRATMAITERRETVRWSKSQKGRPSSDCRLATRLHEVGIASNRVSYDAVNVFLSLVHTARQVMGVGSTRSRFANLIY